MKKYIVFLVSCWIVIPALAKMPTEVTYTTYRKPVLNIQHWVLDNGAKIYFFPAHGLPMLDIQVTFDAGSSRDGTKFGIATLTNALLSEGSQTLSADDIAQRFDESGAQFGLGAGRDTASLSLRTLTEPAQMNEALSTFAQVITDHSHPVPRKSFLRVQKQLLQGLKAEAQYPSKMASDAFFSLVYGTYPYAHSPLGTEKTIMNLRPEDTLQFYAQYYVGSNVIVALVGDIDRATAETIAKQLVGSLPKGVPPQKLATPSYRPSSLSQHIDYPSPQTYVRMGELGISRNDPDYFPLTVGNFILGGGGSNAELFKEVRGKRGFTYNISSYFMAMKNPGPFVISLQTRNETAKEAVALTRKIVSDFVSKGPSDTEVAFAKKTIIGSFMSRLDSNAAILENLSMIAFYGLPLDYLENYQARVMAVTKDQITHAFARRLHPDRMVTVTVGPVPAENK